MPLTSIPLVAQVIKDESELAAQPYYVDADKMRSVAGKMETIGGQERLTPAALTGVARGGIMAWADLHRAGLGRVWNARVAVEPPTRFANMSRRTRSIAEIRGV